MKTTKRFLAVLLMLCMVIGEGGMIALADSNTLNLPSSVKRIEEEAFYGDRSLDEVVLSEGIEEIGTRAFANSSCALVSFPKSLNYIAPDAFDGCSRLVGSAIDGSYAADYLRNNGILHCLWEDPELMKPEILSAWQSDTDMLTVSWMAVPEADRYYIYKLDTFTQEKITISVNNVAEHTDGNVVTASDWIWPEEWHDENTVTYQVTVQAISNNNLLGQESDPVTVIMKKGTSVTGISIKVAISMSTGDSRMLTATITPENASNQNVIWSSSNEDVAIVEDGLVTATGMGKATITATTQDGGFTDTCNVTVNMPKAEITVLKNGGGKAGIFSWKAVPQAVSYNLYYKKGSSGSWTFIDNTTDLTYRFILDSKGGSWSFAVAGVAADGTEGRRSEVALQSLSTTEKPVVTLESVTDTTATVSWTAVGGADHYYVWTFLPDEEDALQDAVIQADDELRYTITALEPGQTYTIEVFATYFDDSHGSGNTVTATTSGNAGTSEFVVIKGTETVIGQGQTRGTFSCGTAAGFGDVATFRVSSNNPWMVSASSNWMSVEKTDNTTAVVTIGNVEDGLNYSDELVFTSGSNQYNVTVILDKTGLSDRFVIEKGSQTIVAMGERTGYFTCGTAAGPGDVATFTISSSNDWTVNNNGSTWMSVTKKNSTTAVMTIGDVENGEKYDGILTFISVNGIYQVYVTLDKTSLTDTPSFTGSFAGDTKILNLGEQWIVEGSVSLVGGSGFLGKITVNALGINGSNMTDDFSAHHFASVQLNRWGAYTIDTTKAPWNTPGTYTLRLWAKDTSGAGGAEPLAMMTLVIKEMKPAVVHPSDKLSAKLSVLREALPDGEYWSSGGKAVTISYGTTSVTTYVSSDSKCYHKSGVKSTCQSFGFNSDRSWQCAGYGRLIGWALSGNDPYQERFKLDANDSNRASLVSNLEPGDIIRVGNDRHTMVVIDTDETYIYVTHVNYDYKCGIIWDGRFTRAALSSNGGTGEGEPGRNRLFHVYKINLYMN